MLEIMIKHKVNIKPQTYTDHSVCKYNEKSLLAHTVTCMTLQVIQI